jgi:adenosylhomocysteine nucleosidase
MNPKPLLFAAMQMETRAIGMDAETVGIRACRLRHDAIPLGTPLVIMAGLGGALDPALNVGDIVVHAPLGWSLPTLRTGTIHTVDRMITDPAEKASLFKSTGGLAIDMENAIVRRAAESRGVPFVGIRAISDTAGQAIDAEIFNLVDEIGRPRPIAAMSLLARRPGLIRSMRRLQSDTEIALAKLAEAVRELVELIRQ